jgi:hypothetical protein
VVHDLVFPRGRTSDDVPYDSHNLWLLDERLCYHAYLSSDVPISRAPGLSSTDPARPDLMVMLDHPAAFADSAPPCRGNVVLVEFKRAMRKAYGAEDDPVQQVYDYIDKIRAGQAETVGGRPLQADAPFLCYVVADLTEKMRQLARGRGFQFTPDGLGCYFYNSNYGAYVEIISFDKLLRDAQQRNRVLFAKLSLPSRIASGHGGHPVVPGESPPRSQEGRQKETRRDEPPSPGGTAP